MRPISSRSRGIGLRQEHLDALCSGTIRPGIDFLELAPENWMAIGGAKRAQLHQLAERYPLVAHGLSLSLGDCQPLNRTLLGQIRTFLDEFGIEIYSEHLSFSRDEQGYLYELLPVPRQWENIPYLAERIEQVQEALARPLVLENISYYHGYGHEMPEENFLAELVARSGCELLLDINNVFVNSRNHGYCPKRMSAGLPGSAIRYFHIAVIWKRRTAPCWIPTASLCARKWWRWPVIRCRPTACAPCCWSGITICHRWQSWRPRWRGCTAPVAR